MARQQAIAPVEVLRTFHRSRDGFIATARKSEADGFKPLAGLPVSTIDEWFPSMVAELAEDGYFTPNTMGRAGSVDKRTGFAYPIPTNNNVKYLNAQYVDIDNYKMGVSAGAVLGLIYDYAENGVVPWPSVWAFSGRGVYVFWILRDEQAPEFAPLARDRGNREKYRAIETALVDRFLSVGADEYAKNESRYLRWPGTRHSGSGKVARYLVNIDAETGAMPIHTLTGMVDALGLTFTPLPTSTDRPKLPSTPVDAHKAKRTAAAGGTRQRAPHRARVRELEILNDMRGGFREGCREYVLWVFACSLRSMGLREADVHQHARAFASKFNPPLPADRVDHQAKRRASVSRWRNAQIAKRLQVTAAEYALLDALVPASVRDGRNKTRCAAWKEKRTADKEKYIAWLGMCFECIRQRGPEAFPRPVTAAAKKVGVSRMTLHRWEKELRLAQVDQWPDLWIRSGRVNWWFEALHRITCTRFRPGIDGRPVRDIRSAITGRFLPGPRLSIKEWDDGAFSEALPPGVTWSTLYLPLPGSGVPKIEK